MKDGSMQIVDKFKVAFVVVQADDELWDHCLGRKISGILAVKQVEEVISVLNY